MGTSIITIKIKEGLNDDWEVKSPFPVTPLSAGQTGYIISTSNQQGVLTDYKLLEDYLYNVSKINNSINFLQKTRNQTQEQNKSSGIGGYAKLKDFTFTIEGSLVEANLLYGREVEVGNFHVPIKDSPSTPDEYEVYFVGSIQKVKQLADRKLQISVQGLSSNSNTRISGTPVIDNEGVQVFNTIILGNGDGIIKLNKTRALGGLQLSFDDSKFDLEEIYIKGKDSDDLYKVNSPWKINNGLIFFTGDGHPYLNNKPSLDANSEELLVRDRSEWYIKLKGLSGNPSYPEELLIEFDDIFPPARTSSSRVIFYKDSVDTEVVNGEETVVYSGDQASTHPDYLELYDSVTVATDRTTGVKYEIEIAQLKRKCFIDFPWVAEAWYPDDSVPAINNEDRIERWYSPLTWDINKHLQHKGMKRLSGNYSGLGEVFLNPENSPSVVIQINDEKMLVLWAETHFRASNRKLRVVRGYQGTPKQVHSRFDDIIVLSSEANQNIMVDIRSECNGFKFLPEQIDSLDEDIQTFFDNSSIDNEVLELTISSNSFEDKDWFKIPAVMSFSFPDFSARIVSSIFKGFFDISVDESDFKRFVGPFEVEVFETGITMMVSSSESGKDGTFGWRKSNPPPWDNFIEKERFRRSTYGYNLLNKSAISWGDVPETEKFNKSPTSFLRMYLGYYAKRVNGQTGSVSSLGTNSECAHAMVGSWAMSSRLEADSNAFYKESPFGEMNLVNLSEYSESEFALGFVKNRRFRFGNDFYKVKMTKPYFDIIADVSLKDNDFYGKVKVKDSGGNGTIVDTVPIGTNASLYVEVLNGYVFAESDTIPFVVYRILPTGQLLQLSIATLANFPTMGTDGKLGRISNSGDVAKIKVNQSSTLIDYIKTEPLPNYPSIEQKVYSSVGLQYSNVSSNKGTWNSYVIEIVGTNIVVTKKDSTSDGNPANLLYLLLKDYALIPANRIDKATFDATAVLKVQHTATVLIQEEININVIIDRLAKEHGILIFEGNDGLIKCSDLVPLDPFNISIQLTDASLFFNGNKLPDVKIEHTDMDFLITDLETRYSPFEGLFKEQLFSKDLTQLKDKFNNAKNVTNGNEIKVALELLSVFNEKVARICSEVKMFYHFSPSRIFRVRCILPTNSLELGTWLSFNFSQEPSTSDNIYLVIGNNISLPYHNNDYYVELILYEYDYPRMNTVYQEIPSIAVNENYQEIPDNSGDGFQEEPAENR